MIAFRSLLKMVARLVATLLVSPALVSYWLSSPLIGRDRALHNTTQGLALLPGLTGQYLRRAFLTQVLESCHYSITVEFGTIFSKTGARLSENVYIGPSCHIGLAHIERDAILAAGVHVPSGARIHGIDDLDRPIWKQPGRLTIVRIGAGSWIGSGAIVMAEVGCNTVVGAGSVVTKPLPDYVVAAGVPARIQSTRAERAESRSHD